LCIAESMQYKVSVSNNSMQAMWCGAPTLLSWGNAINTQCDMMPIHALHQLHHCSTHVRSHSFMTAVSVMCLIVKNLSKPDTFFWNTPWNLSYSPMCSCRQDLMIWMFIFYFNFMGFSQLKPDLLRMGVEDCFAHTKMVLLFEQWPRHYTNISQTQISQKLWAFCYTGVWSKKKHENHPSNLISYNLRPWVWLIM
jgi:hypothetical protein